MAYPTQKTVKKLALAGTAMALIAYGPAMAQEAKKIEFDIEAQELGEALNEFGIQSGKEVYYLEADIAGKRTKGIEGSYSADEAINLLLNNTGIPHSDNGSGTVLIGEAYIQRASLDEEQSPQPFRVARVDQGDSVREIDAPITDEDEERVEDTIVVTGTLIRGLAPESSPVRSYSREEILITGAATAQDFIQTLPQNFGGGSNASLGGGLPNDDSSGFNGGGVGTFGASVNLRGLGSGSTLVLLNGRRIAPSSAIGDFVDVSMIPASAIERVEVLTDGASSIYGADAVAGVVNFVLKNDFDGVEAGLRYGSVTDGEMDEFRTFVTGGRNWDSGNALLSYEYFEQDALRASDREFSIGAPDQAELLPSQERHNLLFSGRYNATAALELFLDATYSRRESQFTTATLLGDTIAQNPTSQSMSIASGASIDLLDTWVAVASGAYSEVKSETDQTGPVSLTFDQDSSIWTADINASGDVFDLPGGTAKLAVGAQYREESFSSFNLITDNLDNEADRDVLAIFGELAVPLIGPGNSQFGVERLELNISGRYEEFSDFGSTSNPKVGVLWSPLEGLNVRGSYSTSYKAPALGRVGQGGFDVGAFPSSFLNLIFGLTPADPSIANVTTLLVSGTDVDLEAETSTSYSLGVDYDKAWGRHKFSFSTTYFDIDFDDRLGSTPNPDNRPEADAPNIAFADPGLFPPGVIVFSPSQATIDALLNDARTVVAFPGADPATAEIINAVSVVQNLAENRVRGFDFSISNVTELNDGTLILGLDGTYIDAFEQRSIVTSPLIDQVNTLFNPIDLRLRGQLGYSINGLSANLFVNHSNSYQESNAPGAASISSWTTTDLSISYAPGAASKGSLLQDSLIRLSVRNLFDKNPPRTSGDPSFGIFGYDPTNASPLNRFVSLEISKRF